MRIEEIILDIKRFMTVIFAKNPYLQNYCIEYKSISNMHININNQVQYRAVRF